MHIRAHTNPSYSLHIRTLLIVFIIVFSFAVFSRPSSAAAAEPLTLEQEQQLASLSAYLDSLKSLLATLQGFLFSSNVASGQTADTTPPSTPTGLTATAVSASQINLSWNVSTDNVGVAGYKIYRSGEHIASVNALSYSDTGGTIFNPSMVLSAGTSYNYTVKAYDAAGNESGVATDAWATTQSNSTIPNPPTLNSITAQYPFNLSWNVVSGASWYNIYRRTPAGSGTWPTTATFSNITGITYVDASVSPGSYEYYVISCNSNGSCSNPSNYQSVTVSGSDTSAPSTPAGLSASVISSSQISLSWNASTDDVGVAGYRIYRNGSLIVSTSYSPLSYSDSGLVAGTTYSYTISAQDAAGNSSSQSASVSATTQGSSSGGSPPPTPGTPTPTAYSGWIGTSYTFNTLVYSDPDGNQVKAVFDWGDGTSETAFIAPASGGTSVSASHAWTASGLYNVKTKAVDSTGLVSSWSSAASMTVGTPPNSPSNLTATVSGSDVILNWTDNSNNETGFKVYRGPVWTGIGDVGTNITTKTVSGLTAGTYDFKVQAFTTCCGSTYPIYSDVSNVFTVTVGGGGGSVPAAPTLSASTSQSSQVGTIVNLSWNYDSSSYINYTLYRTTSGASAPDPWPYSITVGNGFSYADYNTVSTPLPAGTWYYKVKGCNSNGCSAYSNVVTAVVGGSTSTTTGTTGGSIPPNPINFQLDPQPTLNTIYLQWNDVSGEDKYNIERSSAGANSWTFLSQLGANATSYTDSGITSGTYYDYRVQACLSGYGCSSYSYLYSVRTATETPTSTTAKPDLTILDIYLGTNINYPGSTTHDVLSIKLSNIGTVAATSTSGGLYIWIDDVREWTYNWSTFSSLSFLSPGGITIVQPQTLSGEHKVKAQIDAGNVVQESDENNNTLEKTVSLATTAADTTAPSTPSNFNAYAYSSYRVDLSWTASTDNIGVSGYKIYRNGSLLTTIYGLFYADSSVSPNTSYTYEIQAYDAAGNLSSKANKSVNTPALTTFATPYVSGWGLSVAAESGKSTIGVSFNTEMNKDFLSDTNFYVYRASDPSDAAYRLSGSFQKSDYSFSFTLSNPLTAGTEYISVVKADVKSKSGTNAASDYTCRFTALSSGYYTSCPTGSGLSPAPPPQPIGIANAVLKGAVSDASDKPVAQAWIHVYKEDYGSNFDSVTDSSGAYSINIPTGTYYVEVFPPYTRNELLRPSPLKFSVASNETRTVNFKLGSATLVAKLLSGSVTFSNSLPVADARVGAYSERTGQWVSTVTDQSGSYSLRLGPGRWSLNIVPADTLSARWRPQSGPQTVEFRDDNIAETKTLNFSVNPATTKVAVRVIDENNTPLGEVGVVLNHGQASATAPAAQFFGRTDSNGMVAFYIPPGRYSVRAYLPPESGFLNPEEVQLDVRPGEEKEIEMIFVKRTAQVAVNIYGVARLDSGKLVNAFVWGWSDKAGFIHGRANEKGEFALPVSKGSRWHIGAGAEDGGFPYKSFEVVVDTESVSLNLNLTLLKISKDPLPPPVAVTRVVNQQIIAQADNGAKVVVPENTVAASGEIKVEVTPTVEAPSQSGARVVGTVYDVGIEDKSGKSVTQLEKEVEITLPYTEADLKAQGATEDTIQPSYFDDKTGAWVKVDNYTVDKAKKVVIARVKHLTRFALVAPADIVPPQPPTDLISRLSNKEEVTLAWANPKADFYYAKLYRSEEKGGTGTLLADLLTAATYVDKTVKLNKTYYYTSKAVDAAGNESVPSKVRAVTITGKIEPALPTTGKFSQALKKGSRGSIVKTLQQLLVDLGFLPEDHIPTEFYGSLTQAAVEAFQKSKGLEAVGYLGPKTRAELNKLVK